MLVGIICLMQLDLSAACTDLYFECIFIPIWQHCLQYTATLCTVLSFAFAHFAKDSVLWGKLEKLCQFKVLNSTKQSLYFLGFKRKMHLCENVSD